MLSKGVDCMRIIVCDNYDELSKKGLIYDYDYSNYGSKNSPVSKVYSMSKIELMTEKKELDEYFKKRNRQFYPIR